MRSVFAGLLLLLLVPSVTHAQSTADSLTTILEEMQKSSGLPGFAAAIVNKDTVLYQQGFGFADIAHKQPYTTGTLQSVASVSKTLVGVAVMKAIEQGLFTMETNINDILPFRVANPYSAGAPIKVRHLVTHTSGIIDRDAVYKSSYRVDRDADKSSPLYKQLILAGYDGHLADTTLGAFLQSYLAAGGALYNKKNFAKEAPGTGYNYTNIGAALAAYLVEVKSGMSFAAYTEQYILKPLQMDHSGWFAAALDQNQLATLYDAQLRPYPRYAGITYPDGGLITSCKDLSAFLRENMAGYYGQAGILSAASFKTLTQPAFTAAHTPKHTDPNAPNIGVFWTLRKSTIGHSGGDGGVSAFMYFNPEKGFGMIFMTNTEIEGLKGVNEQLLESFQRIWKTMGEYGGRMNR